MNHLEICSDDYQKKLKDAWEHFINNENYDYSFMREEIIQSWKRSREMGANPLHTDYTNLSPDELNMRINKNIRLIEIVHPHLERLYSFVKGSGSYILLCDKDGYIIDYKGDDDIIAKGGNTKLGLGSIRSEKKVGTNGIGTSLYLEKPIQIWGQEHYSEKHKDYACSGAPFFDAEGNIYGCINVTVSLENAHPHTLGMVLCAADSITKEIKLRQAMKNVEFISMQRNSIIENISSGIILLNSIGRVTQINKQALGMLMLSYEEIIGQDLFEYISIDYFDKIGIRNWLNQERYNEEVSMTLRHSPATHKRFNLSINHVKDLKGNVNSYIVRLNKPELINRLVKNISGFRANYSFDTIVGTSPQMERTISIAKKAAESDSNVLILGESGTGKELIAQSIHNASSVANGPFVAINCAAIPNSLVESELFGYEKGSFTGAEKEGRPGKFEMADGGTIFLDEIGDMPLNVQASLLRVIQTKEIIRIGGKHTKPVNIRIIAATNVDLAHEVEQKTFRSDLYYRLNVMTVSLPPLKDRGPEDIRLLADHFVQHFNAKRGTMISISEDVYSILQAYDWPGNVRQLENVIERAINLRNDDIITREYLPSFLVSDSKPNAKGLAEQHAENIISEEPIKSKPVLNIIQNEKMLIVSALKESNGNVSNTAKLLNMNKRTLYRKIDRYEINTKEYK